MGNKGNLAAMPPQGNPLARSNFLNLDSKNNPVIEKNFKILMTIVCKT